MLAARDLFKPIAQTEESKLMTGAPVMSAFVSTQIEPSASQLKPVQIPFAPEYTTQPVAKPTMSVMNAGQSLYDSAGVAPSVKAPAVQTLGAPVSALVDSVNKASNPMQILAGGVMPTIPPLNLSMATSSESKTGAQTSSGGFVSHGINFGTATTGGSNNLLLLAALGVAAFLLMRKK